MQPPAAQDAAGPCRQKLSGRQYQDPSRHTQAARFSAKTASCISSGTSSVTKAVSAAGEELIAIGYTASCLQLLQKWCAMCKVVSSGRICGTLMRSMCWYGWWQPTTNP